RRGDFLPDALRSVRMTREQDQRPEYSVGHRVVPGVQEGHELVADLEIAHGLARFLVAGVQEQAGKVVGAGPDAPALLDRAVDERVDGLERARKPDALRRRHPARQM